MKAAFLAALAVLGSCSSTLVAAPETPPPPTPAPCNAAARPSCEGPGCDPERAATGPALSVRRGRVSYYADRFAGRRTASGERYDPDDLTAASRDLPFGALVRVIRKEGGQRVIVRINDRGPSQRGHRILDLSKSAARCLDMLRAGVVEVRAEVVDWGPRGRPR
ncbi:MAG: septal ring lytic transglycosylase RlpA family protein [Polyangiales bacterium]